MILECLARTGRACPDRADGGLPRRASEEAQSQEAPNGRFYASKSFAIGSIVNLLTSIANVNRWRILEILSDGEICVCKIPLLISITQPAISQHLKVLLEAGLVDVRQEGTKRLYSLSQTGKNIFSTISACLGTQDKKTEKTNEEKNLTYTERDSKIGIMTRSRPDFESACIAQLE